MRKWIDMHCDTLSELLSAETLEENSLCVDRKRMEQTKMLAEFFACFVCVPDGKWEEAYQKVIEMIARMERETKENKKLKLIKTAKELEYAEREELNLALLTVEEGGVLNGNRNRLEELYQRGVRLITLTWNYENCIGYPNSRNAQEMQKGLKSFGKQMVEEMNERGMLVDVSHLSDGGFWDCIRLSKKPIIASHSNAAHFVRTREIFRMRCFVHSGNAEVLWDLIFIRSFYKAIGQRRFWILQSMGCISCKKPERILWHWEQISMDLRQGRTGFAGLKRSSVYGML